jgi:hypothetical protein
MHSAFNQFAAFAVDRLVTRLNLNGSVIAFDLPIAVRKSPQRSLPTAIEGIPKNIYSSGAFLRLTPSRPQVAVPECARRDAAEHPNAAILDRPALEYHYVTARRAQNKRMRLVPLHKDYDSFVGCALVLAGSG